MAAVRLCAEDSSDDVLQEERNALSRGHLSLGVVEGRGGGGGEEATKWDIRPSKYCR